MKANYSVAAALCAGVAIAVCIWLATDYVSADPSVSRADKLSVWTSLASFGLALFAVGAAVWTVHRQTVESRLQRQMESSHSLTVQYEAIFDEIYSLQGTPELLNPRTVERLHNRYFTILMRGFQCFESELISKNEFADWTATIIGRIRRGTSLLDLDGSGSRDELAKQWSKFDTRGPGPRSEFRAYFKLVVDQASLQADSFDGLREEATRVLERAKRMRRS